uniref:Gaduscidin-1 n=1 Tax=Gadus morhua TaxID=8049 RepID=D4HRB8_GADMO|nr:piscidin-1 precursor [Gadus morhua]ADK63423.1 gaduscidin-1 [Gadus morhua]
MRYIVLLVVVLLLAMMVQPADCFIHHIIGWISHGVRAIHRAIHGEKAEEYIMVD